MNTLFVKSAPHGDFAEVSALRSGWQTRLQSLLNQQQPVMFDYYPLPKIPQEITHRLEETGYRELILENDQWQHYLIPNPNLAAGGTRLRPPA